ELGGERRVAGELGEPQARREDDALDRGGRLAADLAVRGGLLFARAELSRSRGLAQHVERAIEQLRRATELAREPACVGRADEEVDDVLDAAAVTRDALRVARLAVRHRIADHLRARLECLGERAAPRTRV